MSPLKTVSLVACVSVLGLAAPTARAIIPVTDIGAILQLIQQIDYWKQQIQAMSDQLGQLKSSYRAMTGSRGMDQLLAGVNRNYLPADWMQLQSVLGNMSGAYGALASSLQGLVSANAVLSAPQLAAFSPQEQQSIAARRQSVALSQALTRQALSATSARFTSLQQLIDAISGASDEKAILDLQARIAAEQGMLQNEQTKLQMLNQTIQAQQAADRQREQELAIADQGQFATRFRPTP